MKFKYLADLCDITIGRTPSRSVPEYWGGSSPWVSISDMRSKYISKTKECITDFGIEKARCRIIKKGTLLLSFKLSIGKLSFADRDLYTNEAIAALQIKDKKNLYPDYLFYALRFIPLTGSNQAAMGKTLNLKSLAILKIPIPENYDDQVRIAGILSRSEGLIEKRKESIRLLDEFLKSTFLDMFGDPVRNEKGWNVVNLEDLCRTIVDCPHSTPVYSDLSTEYYCIRSSDIQYFRVNLSETKEVTKNVYDDRIKRHIPAAGEVVYTREGGRLGYAAILPVNSNICLGQRMMLFIADLNRSTNIFIWSLLNSDSIRKKVLKMAGGGAAPRVNIKDLKQIKVIEPSLASQLEYSEKIRKIESLRIKYQVSLEELERLYGSLSQRAFKGELDLSGVNSE